jgi:hypothetical protein
VGLASTFYDVVVVGIHHCSIGIDAHVQHAIEGTKTYLQLTGLRLQEHIIGFSLLSELNHRVAAGEVVYTNLSAIGKRLRVFGIERLVYQQEDMMYGLTASELVNQLFSGHEVTTRQKTINFFSH